MRKIFISWAPYCSRSDNIAREIDAKSYMIYYGFFGSTYYTIILKYLFQGIETFRILRKERPKIIFCMTPPVLSIIPIWLYTRVCKDVHYILDYHTAAFAINVYKKLFFMQKIFAKHALLNIVTNDNLAKIVEGWGGNVFVIGDVKVKYEKISIYKRFKPGFNVVFVGRYSPTEPLDEIFEAARRLENDGVNFYVTGSLNDAPAGVKDKCPLNVYLTDFLEDSQYAGLLQGADAAMSLCKNDNTMQRGAYEAMALETPLIVSDWELLRKTFSRGTVYVKNDPDSIVIGVRIMKKAHGEYKSEIKQLKRERAKVWDSVRDELYIRMKNVK